MIEGFTFINPNEHKFRIHKVGSTAIYAGSLLRLQIVIRMHKSSTSFFAYSVNTSKYFPPLNKPVSGSSYSFSNFERLPLVRTKSAYGYSPCGYLYKCFMYAWEGVLSK